VTAQSLPVTDLDQIQPRDDERMVARVLAPLGWRYRSGNQPATAAPPCHHGVGILPTLPVAPTMQGIAAGRDEVLERGIAAVSR